MSRQGNKLYKLITQYLNHYVNNPIKEFSKSNEFTCLKLSTQLKLGKLAIENILISGVYLDLSKMELLNKSKKSEYLSSLEKYIESGIPDHNVDHIFSTLMIDRAIMPYIFREINWSIISILSASYISAHILIRSIFELIVKYLTTSKNTGMADMIDNITILSISDKIL